MTYDAIKKYLQEQMKMSHVYQPVMLRRLLIGYGTAKVEEIALHEHIGENGPEFKW